MQIKGFYYKSKSGQISSLNTSDIDVPDAITSAQLQTAVEGLQTQIDGKVAPERVQTLEDTVTSVSARVDALEGKDIVVKSDLEAYATSEDLGVQSDRLDDVSTEVGAISEDVETLQGSDAEQNTILNQLAVPASQVTAILDRLTVLEGKVEAIRHADVEVPEIPEAVTDSKGQTSKTVTSEAEVIVKDIQTDTDKFVVSAKAVELKDVKSQNNTVILNSQGDVTISGMENSGTLERTVSNSQISLQSPEYVKITNSSLKQGGYNVVEIGLSKTVTPPKNVLIDNVDFGTVSNNAILVFGMQDNGVVTVSNCHFDSVSNAVRYSNRTNAKNVTFNFVNCTCDKWDTDPTWAGFFMCQDYTSGTVEKEVENNLFAPEKVKVNFINCTGPKGKINTNTYGAPADFSATGDKDTQLVYVWNSFGKTVAYNPEKYPEVTLK